MKTITKTMPRAEPSTGQGSTLLRHIVSLDPETGEPSDVCLCGYVWDRVFLPHGDEICQECVDLSKKVARKT